MAYTASNPSLYKNNQQLMLVGAVVFGSIVAAIVASSLIVMSLMRGEVASAIAAASPSVAPTTQTITSGPGICVAPQTTSAPIVAGAGQAVVGFPGVGGLMGGGSVANSFNNTNTSSTQVTNNITDNHNKTKTIVTIKDSFNKGSFNEIGSDNNSHNTAIASGNTVDSNNTKNIDITKTTNIVDTDTTTVASGNTVNSNNNPTTTVNSNNPVVNSNDPTNSGNTGVTTIL